MKRITVLRTPLFLALGLCFLARSHGLAQVDPEHRNLLELGYDGPIGAQGPQGVYAYYYYNQPHVLSTNVDLRLAIAPVYVDGELGLKRWVSPITDIGFGFSGGAFGDNYYDVQQGNYLKNESFNGSGGGASLSVYQLLNPGVLIPVSVIVRGGGALHGLYGHGQHGGQLRPARQSNHRLHADRHPDGGQGTEPVSRPGPGIVRLV